MKKKQLNSHTSQPKLSFLLPDYLGLLVQVEVQNVILSFEVFKMSFLELTLSRQHIIYPQLNTDEITTGLKSLGPFIRGKI